MGLPALRTRRRNRPRPYSPGLFAGLEREHDFRAQETHHTPADVEVAREKAFAPEMAGQVLVEFVFEDRLEVIASVVTIAGKRTLRCRPTHAWDEGFVQIPCWHVLIGIQHVIAEAEIHVLDRVHAPGRAEANKIRGLTHPRFLHVAIYIVHFAPLRPSTPQH